MPLDNYTKHQQGIIKRYYENKDTIQLQRLGELVTDLYLAEGKKCDKIWQTVANTLKKLEVPQDHIDHLIKQNDPTLVANLVKELEAK